MCHYPYQSYKTARNVKKTPFYDRLLGKGAVFKDVSGWEVPDWFGLVRVDTDSISNIHCHTSISNNHGSHSSNTNTETITSTPDTIHQHLLAYQDQPPVYSFQKPYFFEN